MYIRVNFSIMICAVVNANRFQRELISKVFASYGDVEAEFFPSFSTSVQFLEQNFVEMIFLGISGKSYNWEEQYKIIKNIDKDTKIVLISDQRVEAVKAFELEATDFLLEPITEKRLEISVQRARAS